MRDSDKQASARYHASHIKRLPVNINDRTDQDIIDHLSTIDNVQGYIKSLIRRDMAPRYILDDGPLPQLNWKAED